jgi:tetratricopeptide (TPR) repeat protein
MDWGTRRAATCPPSYRDRFGLFGAAVSADNDVMGDEGERIYLPQSVLDAVVALANAYGWDEQQRVIEEHPTELLGEYADPALQVLIQQYEGQPHLTLPLEDLRPLLDDCRNYGIAEAFAQRRRAGRSNLRPEVLQALQTMPEDQVVPFLARSPGVQRLFVEATAALVNAASPGAKRAVLLREQDLLLNPAAEILLRTVLTDVPDHTAYADLLVLARDVGVDEAFTRAFGDDVPTIEGTSPEVNEILQELAFAERNTTVERRVELARRGLTLVEPGTPLSAGFQSILGTALLDTYGADRGDRIDEAIAGFAAVAAWAEERGLREAAGSAHERLATAYLERISGDRAANVERAVQEAELAIGFAEGTDDSMSSHYAAAMAYRDRSSGDHADNLRRAHEHARAALESVDTDKHPEAVAGLHMMLGQIADGGGPDDHGDHGRTYLRQASQEIDPSEDPDNWVKARLELGQGLSSGDADDLEESITVLQAALTLASPQRQPQLWADVHSLLAYAYRWRPKGDRSDNLEQAIDHAEQALTVYTREDFPEFWAVALNRLANALRMRLHGNPEINAETAIEHYQTLADFYAELGDRSDWAGIQLNLGRTYANENRAGVGELDKALAAYELALGEYERLGDAGHAAEAHANLLNVGTALLAGGRTSEDFVASVIDHGEHVRAYFTRDRDPDEYVVATIGLGQLNSQLGSNDRDRLPAAARYFEEAIAAVTPFTVLQVLDARHMLAGVHFRLDDLDAALESLELLIGDGERLIAETVTEESQRRVMSTLGKGYTEAAYLEIRRGNWAQALRLLERGRSRLLLDTLGGDVDLDSLEPGVRSRIERARDQVEQTRNALNAVPDRTPAQLGRALGVARAELAEALAGIGAGSGGSSPGIDPWRLLPTGDGALVAPVVTGFGIALFVLPSGVDEITERHVLQLECTRADLADSEITWMTSALKALTGQGSLGDWTDAIEQVTGWLWTAVAGPLRDRLAALGVVDGTPLRLMSSQFSNQLPLHAAWRIENGVKRSLLDDYVISYTPGIRMLYEAERRAAQPSRHDGTRGTALLVADSTGDLPHSVDEVRSIGECFPDGAAMTLIGPDATSAAVFASAAGRSYLHFACHAGANWYQPNYSTLILAGPELVVAGDLANLDLDAARLAVLSACESGMEVVESASDYTGIAAALLRAGAPSVIATLWNVNDLASSLLVRRFYVELLGGGHSAAEALRSAQLWLRDATVADLSSYDSSPADARRWRLLGADSDDRPYENPYFWAGYFLIGA